MNQQDAWTENRKEMNRKMREFRTQMSDFSRLFQRIVMHGNTEQLAKMKLLLKDTNTKLAELTSEVEKNSD